MEKYNYKNYRSQEDDNDDSMMASRMSSEEEETRRDRDGFKIPTLGVSPPKAKKCPSFMNVNGNTGLHPTVQHQFDYNVVRCLESIFDDTASDIFEEEKLKTFLRIRPSSMSKKTDGQGSKRNKRKEQVIDLKDETTVVAYPLQKNVYSFLGGRDNRKQTEFKFTKVFGPESAQSTVYEECVGPVIDKFLKGENCLIFSYGATNSGKTYTLQGHGTDYGIIPRTLDAIFSRIQDQIYRPLEFKPFLYQAFMQVTKKDSEIILQKKERLLAEAASIKRDKAENREDVSFTGSLSSKAGSSVHLVAASPFDEMNYALFANSMLYSVWVSFAELYNERVYDLLDNVHINTKKRRKELRLLQDKDGFVYIKDLTEIQVVTEEETYKIFQAGRKNLQFAATQMNQNSSRSHSFFTLRVITIGIGESLMPYPKTVHRMTFCDLAGMERVHQTENEGVRLKESGTINTSLTVLLKVIRILREKQKSGNLMLETIPFRESKLTHIFKSYFTSSTHIRMIVNVNPDPAMAESTLHVLQNSAIASSVITFRPTDIMDQKPILKPSNHNVKEEKDTHPRVKTRAQKDQEGKNKVRFKDLDTTLSVSSVEAEACTNSFNTTTDSDSSQTDPPTVLNSKLLLERLRELEYENFELKREITRLKLERDRMREETVNIFAEQNRLWRTRFDNLQKIQENMSDRRISLMRRRMAISPGSKCGRDYTPPVLCLDEVAENIEDDLDDEKDKENRPPSSKDPSN